jgi:hypothetical protein
MLPQDFFKIVEQDDDDNDDVDDDDDDDVFHDYDKNGIFSAKKENRTEAGLD